MHNVICKYCGNSFDRDKIAYVEVGGRRYGHASCYKQKKEENKKIPELEIIDPTNFVICCYCKKEFDKRKEPYEQISSKKIAHLTCATNEKNRIKTDEEKLNAYIDELFNKKCNYPVIKKQIKQYIEEYHYSYSGILKALKFFYEIQNNDISKANGTISIIPYIYEKAYNYYYAQWAANQQNINKDIKKYVPKKIEVNIVVPQRTPLKKTYFNFLDKDEIINEQ